MLFKDYPPVRGWGFLAKDKPLCTSDSVGISHTDDFLKTLPSALGMKKVHWTKLNLNVK